tara:strand:- start:1959 stop:2450 length:492 start_codon:yes stop_codon:yes gene_type:complete
MANRAIDLLITYRLIKLLVTRFENQEAFKYGIIDKKGKVLRRYRTLTKTVEKKSYTILHRFVFNLKRILQKVGLGGRLGSFAVALAMLIKEDKEMEKHKLILESAVIKYLKDTNQYESLLQEQGDVFKIDEKPFMTCFGIDIYEVNGELISEENYAKQKDIII